MKANRLTSGKGGNALDCYQEILDREPGNQEALEGLSKIGKKYLSWTKVYIKKKNYKKAFKYYKKAKKLSPDLKDLKMYKDILDEKSLPNNI